MVPLLACRALLSLSIFHSPQELSDGHALWYAGMLTLYHYNYVGVFNINPSVRAPLYSTSYLNRRCLLRDQNVATLLLGGSLYDSQQERKQKHS